MADNTSVDLARVPGDNPVAASPDLLRAMVQAFATSDTKEVHAIEPISA